VDRLLKTDASKSGRIAGNTSGGLLSQGHLEGMNHITEAVKQLRGECGQRQVKGAEIAIVSGTGEY